MQPWAPKRAVYEQVVEVRGECVRRSISTRRERIWLTGWRDALVLVASGCWEREEGAAGGEDEELGAEDLEDMEGGGGGMMGDGLNNTETTSPLDPGHQWRCQWALKVGNFHFYTFFYILFYTLVSHFCSE